MMVINKKNLIWYLFLNNLVDKEKVLCENNRIDFKSGNRSFIYQYENYFIKNLKSWNQNDILFFRNEINFYSIFSNNEVIKKYIPNFFLGDSINRILVIQRLRGPKGTINNSHLKEICFFLNYFSNQVTKIDFQKIKPFVFSQLKTLNIEENLIKKVHLIEKKFSFNSLSHGDFKIENILLTKHKVYIIDWELFGISNKYWDFAYLCASLILKDIIVLSQMIFSIEENVSVLHLKIFDHTTKNISFLWSNLDFKSIKDEKWALNLIGLAILQKLFEFEKAGLIGIKVDYTKKIAGDFLLKPKQLKFIFYAN